MRYLTKISNSEINEMKGYFIEEGTENLNLLEKHFQILETDYKNSESLTEVYRIIHSFKGMCGTMGLDDFETFFHSFESLISSIQKNSILLNNDIIDFFFKSLDVIEEGIHKFKKNESVEGHFEDLTNTLTIIRTSPNENDDDLEKISKMKILFEQYGLEDFTQIKLDYSDKNKKFYQIHIVFDGNIRLKIARIFVIIKNMAKLGKIGQTLPNLPDIVDGNFKNEVFILFQSTEELDTIKKAIFDSGEIKDVFIESISSEKAKKFAEQANKIEQLNGKNTNYEISSELDGVKVNLKELDLLMEYFGELLIRSKQLERSLEDLNRADINDIVFQMQNYMFNLQDIVLQIQMVPISSAFRLFPRMIRNLATAQNKKIRLIINHHDVRVDRKLLKELNDILNHILRNSISHGIETKSERLKNGKDVEGFIEIESIVENNVLNIIIKDDGKGIDLDSIKKTALKNKLVNPEELNNLTENDILNLIFEPNFSTSEKLDKISGRGMGLNIVQQKVEILRGSISVETELGIGTKFIISLPLSRTLIRALLIKSVDQIYSIPLDDIQQLLEISADEIQKINEQDYIFISNLGQSVKLYYLNNIFRLNADSTNHLEKLKLIHIKKGSKNFALVVDEFLKESEIVIKNIESTQNELLGISGAAILDDGTVSLIIDPFTLIK